MPVEFSKRINLALYLGESRPNTRSFHRGSNPGMSEHMAVTLANRLRRSPYLLTLSLRLPCRQYCIITKHDRLRPYLVAFVQEWAGVIKLMNYLNLREGIRLSAQFSWFCEVGSQNVILFIYALTAETFIKTKVFIYQVE